VFSGEGESSDGRARLLGCWCNAGRAYSLTVRKSDSDGAEHPGPVEHPAGGEYAPDTDRGEGFLTSIDTLCRALFDEVILQKSAQHHRGLLVISGSTASGKSQVARGLIWHYLRYLRENRGASSRNPHLVTFEDPIERRWRNPPVDPNADGIDYTPRQKRVDAESLAQVVTDALRQTPSALYVGEVRDDSDWSWLLRFAQTGHLAVTTTHAGSLTEGMIRLLRASRCRTAADRGELAQVLLGVVHLGSHEVQLAGRPRQSIILPTVWRSNPAGVMGLISDGCASILPHRTYKSSLGRQWYVGWLEERRELVLDPDIYLAQLRRIALELDLKGM
jgi:hypothetical protein